MNMTVFLFLFLCYSAFFTWAKWKSFYATFVNGKVNQVPKDYTYQPRVSIMCSAFKEGEKVYDCIKSIMESNYPIDKIEVVAFDDHSPDNTFEYLQKLYIEYPDNLIIHRNVKNLGKCFTLVEIAKQTTGDILISIDSDTIFDKNAIRELVACYSVDKDIGAVGGLVKIKNVNDSIWTQLQATCYVFYFFLYKPVENQFFTSRCLCGPLVSFRREIYMALLPKIQTRSFFGNMITHGEDTYITVLICFGIGLDRAWKVFNDFDAVGWTETPATFGTYFNQQVRWRRGSAINSIFAVTQLFRNVMVAGPQALLFQIAPLVMSFFLLFFYLYLFMTGNFLTFVYLSIIFMMLYGIGKSVMYNFYIGKRDRFGSLKNPLLTAILVAVWTPVSYLVLNVLGLCTMDNVGWVTRQKEGNVS